jgi:hypothetical protein
MSGIKTNMEAVIKAIEDYKQVVSKDADEAARKKMGDIAFRAAKNTAYTSKEIIRSEISNLPITKDGGKKRYGNTKYVGQYKLINWERKLRGLRPLGNSRFRKIAADGKIKKIKNIVHAKGPSMSASNFMDGKYKKFIQARIRSIKFLRAAWGVAAAFFKKPFERGDFGPESLSRFSGKAYGGARVTSQGDDKIEYSMFNGAGQFDTRRKPAIPRSAQDQERAAKIIEDGLNAGLSEVLNDIHLYFEKNTTKIDKISRNLNTFK